MSVLECDRRGCEHIMCSRLILDSTAYICGDCWSELQTYKESWPETMTVAEVREHIEDFMYESPVGTYIKIKGCDVDAEFDRLTRNSQND